MLERFLERIENSRFKNNFIVKGGVLITAMIGVKYRSTNDIDITIKNLQLSIEQVYQIIIEIAKITLNDGISFELTDISNIMDEMEYPGIRVSMNAYLDKIKTPLKIDLSTGDAITPKEIKFDYALLVENRKISIWSYNLETILAEKLQTILSRNILNTRMRDFYDVYILQLLYQDKMSIDILKKACINTCENRGTKHLLCDDKDILNDIANDYNLQKLWEQYQKKYAYAADITYDNIIESITLLLKQIGFMKN